MTDEKKIDTAVITLKGESTIVLLKEKVFMSGKTGYFASDKIKDADGVKYQVILNIVRITSKVE